MSLRMKRLLVRMACHLPVLLAVGIFALVCKLIDRELPGGLFVILLLYIATLRINPLPAAIELKILRATECPGCACAAAEVLLDRRDRLELPAPMHPADAGIWLCPPHPAPDGHRAVRSATGSRTAARSRVVSGRLRRRC